MTFEAFANSILANAEAPDGATVAERMAIAGLRFEGMVSYWNWYREHYPEVLRCQ